LIVVHAAIPPRAASRVRRTGASHVAGRAGRRAAPLPAGIGLVLSLAALGGCGRAPHGPRLFTLLTPERTGVTFTNTITTSESLNEQTDFFVYNGGGVGIGDINNDGLPDIFFAGNQVPSRLYLNKGNLRFEDVTQRAGIDTRGRWCSGVSMVDINNDGFLDIYVSVSGPPWTPAAQRANLLFINDGDGTFTEEAERYGIAGSDFTTHAAFLDYDGDGYLDLFLLGDSPHDFGRGAAELRPMGMQLASAGGYSQLYHNNGDGTFTNVSRAAGLLREIGYGLGVAVADVNRDGWPDIYISDDVTPNDILYVNNRDGTFSDKRGSWLKHTSFAGMGVDVADFNNDGWPDVVQSDMVPDALSDRKRMSGAVSYGTQLDYRNKGFLDDYQVNSLQLSSGVLPNGTMAFSEIAQLAGVPYTGWSWANLFADVDNDGYKDIFVATGYPKIVNDYDYQVAVYRLRRQARDSAAEHRQEWELLKRLQGYSLPNRVFRNEGDLTFSDRSEQWGVDQLSFSNGAAYGDLNNDGRLDLVVNNIDGPAFIYEGVRPRGDSTHYLTVDLQGDHSNRGGIGSTLILTAGGRKQYVYPTPYRGYASSMDDRAHFGLGNATRADSLGVIWPDGRYQLLTNVAVDRILTLKQDDAGDAVSGGCHEPECFARHLGPDNHARSATVAPRRSPSSHAFEPVTGSRELRYTQQTAGLVDFSAQPLLPYMISHQGPPVAVADVDGDGLEDVFIGGSAGVPGRLFRQQRDGSFVESTRGQPWAADRDYDDWGALFVDANGDGRPDLYVASGGYQGSPVSRWLQDRLYVNRGGGQFVRDSLALPEMLTSTEAVAAGDFNGDGRPDLFVGGRLVPRNYPYPARGYLLRNDGGHFTDVTAEVAPELLKPGGMVTAAVWADFNGDGKVDLVTAGEWMPLTFYHSDGHRLHDVTSQVGVGATRGWWYSLAVGDFNRDGHPDLVAGNLGLNFMYHTSAQSRFGVYAADFLGNRTTNIVLTQEIGGTEYPFFGLARLAPSIYPLALRFPSYGAFAVVSIPQVFGADQLAQAVHYQTDTFASLYLQSNGDGTFTASPLPNLAQIAPIRGIIPEDVDGDGNLDLIVAGNLYDTEPNTPRADAGNGLWLKGDGRGHFTPVPPWESGFLAPGDVTGLAMIKTSTGSAVLVANYGDSLQTYSIKR
jgi:hypothetical protein